MVEHHLGKVEVTGSIPVISSNERLGVFCSWQYRTGVAQLVEQRSPKPQAAGSSPAARATHNGVTMLAQTKAFVNDVSKEMKKVSWPDKDKLRQSTIVVIVATLIITAIVAVIDFASAQVMGLIY